MPKFTKGQARPPNSGRGKGTANKATQHRRRLLEAINADDKIILDRVIAEAKAGDHAARNLYFRYLRPERRPETFLDSTEHKKPGTVEEARAEILELSERLSKGEISLETHDAKVNDLRIYLGDTAVEQKRDLDRLKASLEEGGDDELR
jgi:hypothetical protein